jgi:hypothetical protein
LYPKQHEPIRFVLQQLIKTHLKKTTLALLKTGVKAVSELPLPEVLTHLIFQYLGNNSKKIPHWKNLTTLFAQKTHPNNSNSRKRKKTQSSTVAKSSRPKLS